MHPFVARKSIGKTAALVMGCVAFVVIGLALIGVFGDLPSKRAPTWWVLLIGWVATLFFGFCGVSHTVNLLGPSEQLRVDHRGVLWRPWSAKLIPWSEIVEVKISTVDRYRDIVLKLHDPAKYHRTSMSRFFANGGRTFSSRDVHISLLGTDRKFDDAISAINHFRT